MCGINGIVRLSRTAEPVSETEIISIRDSMHRRGPDASGLWMQEDGWAGFGHRRLAIIDLSENGVQPMSWEDGRYWITFNGEIYNYQALRDELVRAGVVFRSTSDTEVILALYAREGANMLSRLRGMFAFAIWDNKEKTLFLARDPYGIKPLYYAAVGDYFYFASQVKALEVSRRISTEVSPAGLVGFLLWGSVPEPHTIRKDINLLQAGHYMCVGNQQDGKPVKYYSFPSPTHENAPDLVEIFADSIQAHLVADVPVAIFLSAGLDSSLIAALARRTLPQPPVTFTITFDSLVGTPYDEGPLAAETARTLGTHHIEKRIGKDHFRDLWSQAMQAMDQPTIDGLNTYVVSQVVHEHDFKVVLSGLGGDELMGGYPSSFREIPQWHRRVTQLKHIPGLPSLWPHLARRVRPQQPKLADLIYAADLAGAYYVRRGLYMPRELPALIGEQMAEEGLALYDPIQNAEQEGLASNCDHDSWLAVHCLESSMYMRNQLLRDTDWASMAHSLELRVPMVDVVLREAMAARNFEPARSGSKADVVKQVAPELPDKIWHRPKSGFSIPTMQMIGQEQNNLRFGLNSRQLAGVILEEFDIHL